MAQRLVDVTLDLVEKSGGCRGVNMRQVAAIAGCNHTNVYNYYDSFEGLLWAAMDQAQERLLMHIQKRLESKAGSKAPLRTFLEAQIDFAQEHPALFRLFWLDPLSGPPPPTVLQRFGMIRAIWMRVTIGSEEAADTHRDPEWPGPVIHGYFHGELCKLVGRKPFARESDDARDRIVRTTLRLIKEIGTPATSKAVGKRNRKKSTRSIPRCG